MIKYNLGTLQYVKGGGKHNTGVYHSELHHIAGSPDPRVINVNGNSRMQYRAGTRWEQGLHVGNYYSYVGCWNDAYVTYDGRGYSSADHTNSVGQNSFLGRAPGGYQTSNYGYGLVVMNCIVKSWNGRSNDPSRPSRYSNGGHSPNNYWRCLENNTSYNAIYPVTFQNSKLIDLETGFCPRNDEGDVQTSNHTKLFHAFAFKNCLIVNSNLFGEITKMEDCTIINSSIGRYWTNRPEGLSASLSYGNTNGEQVITDGGEIKNNYLDENSIIGFHTNIRGHAIFFNFRYNLLKGRISIMRHASGVDNLRNCEGTAYSSGVVTKVYDFRQSNSSRQTHYNNFISADTTHFDSVIRHLWGEGDLPLATGDAGNTSLFNMSDSWKGLTKTSETCCDYTPLTGSTLCGAASDGSDIGYTNKAIVIKGSSSNFVSGTSTNVVTAVNGNGWCLSGGTTGYVETQVFDLGKKGNFRVHKDEKYKTSWAQELVNPVEGFLPITRDFAFSYWFMRSRAYNDHNHQDSRAERQKKASARYRGTNKTCTNVITNGDFTNGMTGWVTGDTRTAVGTHVPTFGFTSKSEGTWRFVNGMVHTLGLDTRGYGAGDNDYGNNDNTNTDASLQQNDCFDADKTYIVIFKAQEHSIGYIRISGSTSVSSNNHFDVSYPLPNYHNYGETYACYVTNVTALKFYASSANQSMFIECVEAYEISDWSKWQVDCYEMRYGDTASACASATYKTYPYGYYCSQDGDGNTMADTNYNITTDSYVNARFVQVKTYLNNDAI